MAKTIEELRAGIKGKEGVLSSAAAKYLSKTVKGNLEREIESDTKRIAEILANQVRLGDGTIAEEGMAVYGRYGLPTMDASGNVQGFTLYARTIKGTKKAADGTGYVTFQGSSKKFERLNWYQAERFFERQIDAIKEITQSLKAKRTDAEQVLATMDEIISFVNQSEPNTIDLVESEEEVKV